MMSHSVPGYNIYDLFGAILYDGSIIRKDWGGGRDGVGFYRTYAYHQLTISPRGKLGLLNYDVPVNSTELVRIGRLNPSLLKHGLNKPFKVYV